MNKDFNLSMSRFLHVFFLLFLPFFISAQLNSNSTNIDPECLRLKWMANSLSSLKFQNGDTIKIARNLSEWKRLNSTGKSNSAVLFIKTTAKGYEYYYNYYAIIDSRNIFPQNYKLPSASDFNEKYIDFESNTAKSKFENSTILHLFPSGSIEWDGVNSRFYFSEAQESSVYLWTNDACKSDVDFWTIVGFERNGSLLNIKKTPSLKTCGYAVKCVEDNVGEIKNRIFEYGCLLPQKFHVIKDSIGEKIINNYRIGINNKVRINVEISFDENGKNVSRIIEFSSEDASHKLVQILEPILKNLPITPYYLGVPLKAKSNLIVEVLTNSKNVLPQVFFINSENNLSQEFKSSFESKVQEQSNSNVKTITQVKNIKESSINRANINSGKRLAQKALEAQKLHKKKAIERERENTKSNKEQKLLNAKMARQRRYQLAKYERAQNRSKRQESRQEEYVINRRVVIKHYLGIALGTTNPILGFAGTNRYSGSFPGYGKMGFSASLDGAFRIKNGVGVKLKADVLHINFNSKAYEQSVLTPRYTIQDKAQGLVSRHYYLIQNLMCGFNFNMGKYKFLFEVAVLGGITTGFGPNFKYTSNTASSQQNSNNKFFVGYGYQASGAFRIRCSPTFAIKIGASYMESRIPNYNSPTMDNYGNQKKGTFVIRSIIPQISFIGMFFHMK